MDLVFLLLAVLAGSSNSLTCYNYHSGGSTAEVCEPYETVCRLLWDNEREGHISIITGSCARPSACFDSPTDTTRCYSDTHLSSFHYCCCNGDLCNYIPNLNASIGGPNIPTAVSIPNVETCVIHECNSADVCSSYQEICIHGCLATYVLNDNHYDLNRLDCNTEPTNYCSERCAINTTMAMAPSVSCCCTGDLCNLPANIDFSDPTRITHFVEEEACLDRRCDHICLSYHNGVSECRCHLGYMLASDNRSCTDMNECLADPAPCPARAQCVNNEGSFTCECIPGYKLAEDGSCAEIEFGCATNLHECPFDDDTCDREIMSCPVFSHNEKACYINFDTNRVIQRSYCATISEGCLEDSCVPQFAPLTDSQEFWVCCCTASRCTEKINISALTLLPFPITTPMMTTIITTNENETQGTSEIFTTRATVSQTNSAVIVALSAVVAGIAVAVAILVSILFIVFCCTRRKNPEHLPQLEDQDFDLKPSEGGFTSLLRRHTEAPVGQGRHGCVYMMESDDPSYPIVAVKRYRENDRNKSLSAETEILKILCHENIVKYLDHSMLLEELVMEYVPRGSLLSLLRLEVITREQCMDLAHSFMSGLAHLHSRKVIHRDIKASNVLVTNNYVCKIADFGLALRCPSDDSQLQQQVGTPRYMSMDMIQGQIDCHGNAYEKIDVYAASLVLWEILSRTRPPQSQQNILVPPYCPPFNQEFHDHFNEDLVHFNPSISRMKDLYGFNPNCRPTIPSYFAASSSHEKFIQLMKEMWAESSSVRPTSMFCLEKLDIIYNSHFHQNGNIPIQSSYPEPSLQRAGETTL